MGKLVKPFADLRQFLGRQPTGSRSEALRPGSAKVCHQAYRQPRCLLHKGMLGSGRNEKNSTRCDGMEFVCDALLASPPQINQKLSMGMAVWTLLVEGLQVTVQTKFSY
jgi:hypothetical protein